MALTVQNGSLVVRDGKLGTGQACCCKPPVTCAYGFPPVSFDCPPGTQCCQSANAQNNSGAPFYHFCARDDVYGVVCWGDGSTCWDNRSRYDGTNGPISEALGLCTEPWATFVYGATSCDDDPCGYMNPLP